MNSKTDRSSDLITASFKEVKKEVKKNEKNEKNGKQNLGWKEMRGGITITECLDTRRDV